MERCLEWFLDTARDRDPENNARAFLCSRLLIPILRASSNPQIVLHFFRRHGSRLTKQIMVNFVALFWRECLRKMEIWKLTMGSDGFLTPPL